MRAHGTFQRGAAACAGAVACAWQLAMRQKGRSDPCVTLEGTEGPMLGGCTGLLWWRWPAGPGADRGSGGADSTRRLAAPKPPSRSGERLSRSFDPLIPCSFPCLSDAGRSEGGLGSPAVEKNVASSGRAHPKERRRRRGFFSVLASPDTSVDPQKVNRSVLTPAGQQVVIGKQPAIDRGAPVGLLLR